MSILQYSLGSEQAASEMVESMESMLERIFQGRSREVSYEESYHNLYCLFKNDKGNLIQQTTVDKLRSLFRSELTSVNPEAVFLEEIARKLTLILSYIQKMMKVYFYVEVNYFEPEKKCSLRHIAYAILKEELMADKGFFNRFTNELVELAFIVKDDLCKDHGILRDAMEAIFKLDSAANTPEIFNGCIKPKYLFAMKNTYRRRVMEFKGQNIDQLIEGMLELYQKEKLFLSEYFNKKKNDTTLAYILKEGYASWATANRVSLFKSKAIDQLLEKNLKLLFKVAKMDEVTLKQFANLFIYKTKCKLDELDHGACLIKQFSELYSKTMASIQDFDQGLSSRVKLTFEVWLNKQPQAISSLNYFIGDLLDTMNQNKENRSVRGLSEFMVIFKFIKDKDEFEKGYRKLLVERIIMGKSVLQSEMKIISMMKEECGNTWTANIEGLLEESSIKAPGSTSWVFSEFNWPTVENFKAILAPEMLKLKKPFEQQYCRLHPSHMLRWHHMLGDGKIWIRSNKGVFLVHMTTPMMNLMLNFNRHALISIGKFTKKCHIELSALNKHLFSLIQGNIIKVNEAVTSLAHITEDTVVSLNLDFDGACTSLQPFSEERKVDLVRKEELSVDRKIMVDSVLIRLMKTKKICKEKELFENTCELIEQKGFSPNEQFIGNCLKSLIQRDFLRKNDLNEIVYVP